MPSRRTSRNRRVSKPVVSLVGATLAFALVGCTVKVAAPSDPSNTTDPSTTTESIEPISKALDVDLTTTTAPPTTLPPTTAPPATLPPPTAPPATAPPPPQTFTDSVYYKNCSEVRTAGADPIFEGEPGYSRKLDRDGDGVACE
ncbi:MAG: excalibur calcium-binding domain-containing protein [Acidimicrobiales bacterium]|nr:excalibur calcium-binding domain-containing protein [Acidimicrobiales bacterium]